MTSSSDFRSKMGRVKGLGAAGHGVGHWWWQRVTAVALVPLSLWFVCSLTKGLMSPDVVKVAIWMSSPINATLFLLLLVSAFFHAKLGLQVVIEDYVHTPRMKYFLLLCNIFFCAGVCLLCTLAVLKLHFLDVISSAI